MTITAARLDAAIKTAGVAITGVSLGDISDRSTWRVSPDSLQTAAQPIIDAYVEPTAAQLADEDAERETGDKKLLAVALALWECIPAPLMTKAQLRLRAKAIYRNLP